MGGYPGGTTMRLTDEQLSEYRELKDSDVDVSDEHVLAPHSGEETSVHYHAKACVAHIAKENGYVANCECGVNGKYDIDVLIWGHPERLSYAVEIEHNPTQEVKESKLNRYVTHTAVDELCLINANELPMNVLEMHDAIEAALGL